MVDATSQTREVNKESYLDKQRFTLEEYLEALQKPYEQPDLKDCNDPRYYKKYAHNLPPLEAYFLIPDDKDETNSKEDT